MAKMDHENVVRLYGVCMSKTLMLVSQFVPLGALLDHLKKFKDHLNAHTMLTYSYQIARVRGYLTTHTQTRVRACTQSGALIRCTRVCTQCTRVCHNTQTVSNPQTQLLLNHAHTQHRVWDTWRRTIWCTEILLLVMCSFSHTRE